jgi:Icc-related predicted phosphoesterase
MKVLFITDLHGCQWKYDRLFKLARNLQVNMVINGGDMLPNSEDLFSQGEFIISYLDDHLAQFDSAGIYYLCCLGNDDLRIFDELLEATCSKYSRAVSVAQRKSRIGGLEFVGFNWVVDYPFRLKDRCRMDTKRYVFQEQLGTGLLSTLDGWKEIKDWFSYAGTLPTVEEEINRLVRPEDMAQSIYVIHMPPYKLGLDESANGQKVGSKAIYDFLLEYQPKLSLHGHIHESPQVSGRWYAKLGDTVCIQPGQLDALTFVVVDLDTLEFERYTEAFWSSNAELP